MVEGHRPQAGPEGGVDAVAGIGQHHGRGNAGLLGTPNLIKRDLGFGLERDVVGTPAFARRSRSSVQASGR